MKVISNISNTIGAVAQATQSTAMLAEKIVGENGLGRLADQLGAISGEGLDETLEDMRLDRQERLIQRKYKIKALEKKHEKMMAELELELEDIPNEPTT